MASFANTAGTTQLGSDRFTNVAKEYEEQKQTGSGLRLPTVEDSVQGDIGGNNIRETTNAIGQPLESYPAEKQNTIRLHLQKMEMLRKLPLKAKQPTTKRTPEALLLLHLLMLLYAIIPEMSTQNAVT